MPNLYDTYRLFFTDTHQNLWVVLKDGRFRLVKPFYAFCGSSSHQNFLLGIDYKDEKSLIIKSPLAFADNTPEDLELKVDSYHYHPSLYEGKKKKLAVIRADLIHPIGTGDLLIYHAYGKRYRFYHQSQSAVHPIFWDTTGDLYFLNPQREIIRLSGKKEITLSTQKAECFCVNHHGTQIAFFANNEITIRSLAFGTEKNFIAFNVECMAFSKDNLGLYFCAKEDIHHCLYFYNFNDKTLSLCGKHSAPIQLLIP